MSYLVRQIAPGEWRELRGIRMAAPRDSPTAFSPSYADAAAYTDAYWQEQAADEASSKTAATFIACDEIGNWVGMASAGPLAEVPGHAHIHAVYVFPAHRGPAGLAARLMEVAIRFAAGPHRRLVADARRPREQRACAGLLPADGFEMTGKVVPYRLNPAEKLYLVGYSNFRGCPAPGSPTRI